MFGKGSFTKEEEKRKKEVTMFAFKLHNFDFKLSTKKQSFLRQFCIPLSKDKNYILVSDFIKVIFQIFLWSYYIEYFLSLSIFL